MSLKLWPGLVCSSAVVGEMLELIFFFWCCGSEGGTLQIYTVIVQKTAATTAELPACALGEARLYF